MKSIHDGRGSDAASRRASPPPIAYTMATIKCVGAAVFRSKQARDFACLLDLDPDVVQWTSAPPMLCDGNEAYQLDFVAITQAATFLIDVGNDEPRPPPWVVPMAESMGHRYRSVGMAELEGGLRLRNAKDLLRYGFYRPALGDRIRILAAMEEMGSLTVAECMSAVREGRPMPTVAALILQGFLEIELDEALIGPETQVRRIRG